MKKWFALLVWLLLFAACSSDSNDNETLPTGNYVASNGGLVLSAELTNGKCQRLTAFYGNAVFYQSTGIQTTGEYPNYTYWADTFSLTCNFVDCGKFRANVSGTIPKNISGNPGVSSDGATITGLWQFDRYTGVLDANGDGVLDSSQGI
jgi:hypothetical protein